MIQKKRCHSKYSYQSRYTESQNTCTETGNHYITIQLSAETDFNRSATIKGTSELDINVPYTDVSVNDNMMEVKTNIPKVSPDPEMYVDVPNAPQQNDNLAMTNPMACGEEYEFPVPMTATVISNTCNEGNESTTPTLLNA